MPSPTIILFSLVGAVAVAAWLVWRMLSRRRHLPCPSWLAAFVELDNPLARENRASRIIERLDVREGMTVLDAGCGPGRLALPLAEAVGSTGTVVALDAQEAMLEIVGRKARERGVTNIRPVAAQLQRGVLEAETFDRAVLVTVLGEIPNQGAALAAIHASLKTGGKLAVTETVFDPHCQSRRSVTEIACSVGLQENAVYGNRLACTMVFEKA